MYSLLMLWRGRSAYVPAVLTIAASVTMVAVQTGLLLGLLRTSSVPVDRSRADFWLSIPEDVPGVPQTSLIPEWWALRAWNHPDVEQVECLPVGSGTFRNLRTEALEICILVGARSGEDSLALPADVGPAERGEMAVPGGILLDGWTLADLGMPAEGDAAAEINGRRVRLAGRTTRCQGFNYSWIYCSDRTARDLCPRLAAGAGMTSFILVRCRPGADKAAVGRALRAAHPDMGVSTTEELSWQIRRYWLLRTRGGLAMLSTLALSLLVGLIITSQTLRSVIVKDLPQYAVLDALGVPPSRVYGLILQQSFCLGVCGTAVAVPLTAGTARLALVFKTTIVVEPWIMLSVGGLAVGLALLSGAAALAATGRLQTHALLR